MKTCPLSEVVELIGRSSIGSRYLPCVRCLDLDTWDSAICKQSPGPFQPSARDSPNERDSIVHLLKTWMAEDTSSRASCWGTPSSTSSSLAVGIQIETLPSSTRNTAAKCKISPSIASRLYARFGGIYLSCLSHVSISSENPHMR